jgi:UDP-N-acetylenolpyruvoylglucosamine reductase
LLDKKVASNGWVGTVGDLWKWKNARKSKVKKQTEFILILRFYLKIKKPRNQETAPEFQKLQNIRKLYRNWNLNSEGSFVNHKM